MSGTSKHRSECPVVFALDLFGDRWTLLIVRDLIFAGKTQYRDFLNSTEGISTNILAERLKRLERCGIVTRERDEQNLTRYHYRLTDKGLDLLPALLDLILWAADHEGAAPGSKYIKRLRRDRRGVEREMRRRFRETSAASAVAD